MTDERPSGEMVHDAARPATRSIGGTDAGAHLTMFCGAGSNLLPPHALGARRARAVSIEQAVHCMTQRTRRLLLAPRPRRDRNLGKRGDLAVFALDEIETRGLERRVRPARGEVPPHPSARGFRAVAVAGELTVSDGDATGALPARLGSLAELSTSN